MGASPARLVIALSVAGALAIFVVYTALAGNGVADLSPSTVAGHSGDVSLMGTVVGKPYGNSYRGALRFVLKDIRSKNPARVPVVYRGALPDQFKAGGELVVQGALRNGVFVAKRDSMIMKCPDHYAPAKSSNT